MQKFEVITFATDSELARTAANAWLEVLEKANRHSQTQYVALSGGRIARHFFNAVAKEARLSGVSFANVHFFWADERCVPPDDPESNFALATRFLLEPLAIPPKQIHRIRGEDDPEAAASAATVEICRVAPCNDAGQPVLDLIFLGMGEDGHVASLFPDAAAEQANSPVVYRAVRALKPPPRRITLDYAPIAVAKEVWLLASGPGKQQALQASLTTENQTPLARVLRSRSKTTIFTDIEIGRLICL